MPENPFRLFGSLSELKRVSTIMKAKSTDELLAIVRDAPAGGVYAGLAHEILRSRGVFGDEEQLCDDVRG